MIITDKKKVVMIGRLFILLGFVYYLFVLGKVLYNLGFDFLGFFDLSFEGLTLPTVINPAIIIFWGIYESASSLPIWFSWVNYFLWLTPPLLLLIGGFGILKNRKKFIWMLKIYWIYWALSTLLTITLIIKNMLSFS